MVEVVDYSAASRRPGQSNRTTRGDERRWRGGRL